MGVKELWSILTPYAERKPICELRGKKVAIDLAGWVCESLNVVDYFVHPRHHLKNLFFRTCYLIWEQVTPVFVLEGVAPNLKNQVISKRNELQFRGVRPKNKLTPAQTATAGQGHKGRTRFNHVLKQCENLLLSMGIQCVQGPGEAEAYCAFLNKHGLVDGVISQDSDCFAYGALRVYRNFSVSTQGTQAAAGGAIDIYDMKEICNRIDFGQHKVIVMALLCGCDYCPDGIGGIGKDGVLKLFKLYNESEILEKLRKWRHETETYNSLEMRVEDKNICTNCGHIGRTQSHSKNGCSVCRTHRGCDEKLWKDKRLSIKSELALRKKALENENFPNEEVISEFLSEPALVPHLNLDWKQPNIVKFIKQVGILLQWPEIYCFQKFFPIVTRWQLLQSNDSLVQPLKIIKKRTVKGVASLELQWKDTRRCFNGLIPHDQISQFEKDNPNGLKELYSTIEPLDLLHNAYPSMVDDFIKFNEKEPKRSKKTLKLDSPLDEPNSLPNVTAATKAEPKQKRCKKKVESTGETNQRKMFQFLKQKENTPVRESIRKKQCSTPINKCLSSDLESDCEMDISDIIKGIVTNPHSLPVVTNYAGHLLHYKPLPDDLSIRLTQLNLSNVDVLHESNDKKLSDNSDLLFKTRRELSMNLEDSPQIKSCLLDDSFDLLVKGDLKKVAHLVKTPLDRFKHKHHLSTASGTKTVRMETAESPENTETNVSFFFNNSVEGPDVFEQLMESNMVDSQDVVLVSESE